MANPKWRGFDARRTAWSGRGAGTAPGDIQSVFSFTGVRWGPAAALLGKGVIEIPRELLSATIVLC
jgi:hypothetical protein